jgi:[CysO sulfur-carrier protein]-S-L-cysteine hydrolase
MLPESIWLEIVEHIYAGLPNESCGLLAATPAPPDDAPIEIARFYPCRNDSDSALVYTLNPLDHLRADRDAEERGLEIVGVVHSHTHSDAYPSPTDVRDAPDPAWHYPIVSLRDLEPVLRSYRIVDGTIAEEPVRLVAADEGSTLPNEGYTGLES